MAALSLAVAPTWACAVSMEPDTDREANSAATRITGFIIRSLLYVGKCSGSRIVGETTSASARCQAFKARGLGACISSPVSRCGSAEIAAQIHGQDDHTNKNGAANDEPLGQIGIYNCVESMEKERAARGADACATFEPGFGDGKRTRRPRN